MSTETEVAAAGADTDDSTALPVHRLRRRNRIEIWLFVIPTFLTGFA